jgi:serine protease Do
VAHTLITDGKVRHAYLGILLGDVREGVKIAENDKPDVSTGDSHAKGAPPRAAWVKEVQPNTPAQKAGLHAGDVLTKIDNQKIESAGDVVDYVSGKSVGNKVSLGYLRDGKPGNVQVTLGELDSEKENGEVQQDRIGMALQTLTPEVAGLLGVDAATKGAVVTEVVPGSRAARAGLRAEDVIVEVDRKAVSSADDAIAALKDNAKAGHLMRIRRGGAARFITIPAQ